MVIDTQDPERDLLLNICFFGILGLAMVSAVTWRWLGFMRWNVLLHWLIWPVLGMAVVNESLVPTRFDIRIDLLILLPAYGLVIVASDRSMEGKASGETI